MSDARKNYALLQKGILNLIRAADLYLVHLLAKHREENVNAGLVNNIMGGHNISGYAINGGFYKAEDIEFLDKQGHLKEIGQQIILSIYTSIEVYLIDKFKEYYRHKLHGVNSNIIEESLKRINPRSLDDIKKIYSDFLDIHIPSFETKYYSDNLSVFQSQKSWDALLLLSKARNEIAHSGESKTYNIKTLLDIWYPFEFSRRWINLFDHAFDTFIYKGWKNKAYDEYFENLLKVKQTKSRGRTKPTS